MNERILELAFKLFNEDDQSEPGTYIQLNVEKFAESIIKECMTICDETRADYIKHRKASDDFTDKNIYAEGEAASDIIKYKMKKHFGVEE